MEKIISTIIFVVMTALFAFPVYWIWNWLMPEIFGFKPITVWQVLGLLLLFGFLFRGSSHSSGKK